MAELLSKYVVPGGEVELRAIERGLGQEAEKEEKLHRSRVLKVLSEDRMEIAMPIENGKLILLPWTASTICIFMGITWSTSATPE